MFVLPSVLVLTSGIVGALASDTNLTLSVHVVKGSLLPHEPLVLMAILSNRSDSVTARYPGRWEHLTGIQFKQQSGERWTSLTRWWQPEVNLPPLPARQLAPHGFVVTQFAFYPSSEDGILRLVPSEKYSLRGVLQERVASDRLVSSEVNVEVSQVPEGEREAYEFLLKQKDLARLLAPVRNVNDVTALPSAAEAFIAKFPASVYSDYLRVSCISYSGQGTFTNQAQLVRYRAELMMTSPWMLDVGWRQQGD